MTEIHNIQDLRTIILLKTELAEVKQVLVDAVFFDSTESYAQNVEFLVMYAQILRNTLKRERQEREDEKAAARTYPIAGPEWGGHFPR